MAGPDGSNLFDNAFGAAPTGPSATSGGSSGGFSFGASTTSKQTPDKTSLVIEYFAGVLSYDDLVNLVGADDAQAIANTPLTSSEKQAVANLRAQSNTQNVPPPAPAAVPDTSTKPKDVTGSYAFQGNLSIDKYGGAVYYTDPVTGDRRLVQGPIAPDNLTDASRFSLTSRSGQTVILDNNTGTIVPVDQAAIDQQVAASVANGGSGAGAGGGGSGGTGKAAPLTIEEQQALNRQAEAEARARQDAAIGAWKQQNPDYQDLGANYVQNPKTGAYGQLAYDDRTGEVVLQPEKPITSAVDPYGNLAIMAQSVPKFAGSEEQRALLETDPQLAHDTFVQQFGREPSLLDMNAWIGSTGTNQSQDYADLSQNRATLAKTGHIYTDYTSEGGVGTDTPINEAKSLGSRKAGVTPLNPTQKSLFNIDPNLFDVNGTPDAYNVVGDQRFPAYSTVPAGPDKTLLGSQVAAAVRAQGEAPGASQSGNPMALSTTGLPGDTTFSANAAKEAGAATSLAMQDTSGPGTAPADTVGTAAYERDKAEGYSDGVAGKPARLSTKGYQEGYAQGQAAGAQQATAYGDKGPGTYTSSNVDASGTQISGLSIAQPNQRIDLGNVNGTPAPSSGGGTYRPPVLPPSTPPPAPTPPPPREPGPVIYQAGGGVDYAGGSLLPASVRSAAASQNGFVSPEQIDMVGHSTGRLYGVAGEGQDGMGPQTAPEKITVTPMTRSLITTMTPPAGLPLPTTPTLLSTRLQQTRRAKVKITLG